MPYKIKHIRGTNKVKVININTGRILAKRTSRKKAKAQIRFLGMINHGR